MTFDLGQRSKIMAPNERAYMISYMSTIQMESPSLMDFEIFAKITFLTFDLDPRSKVITPNESPYMISDMSTIQLESLTHMVFEIVDEKCLFDLSRSSEVKGQGRTTNKNKSYLSWDISILCFEMCARLALVYHGLLL